MCDGMDLDAKNFCRPVFFENKANTNCCVDNSKQFRLAFVCVNNFQLCPKDFLWNEKNLFCLHRRRRCSLVKKAPSFFLNLILLTRQLTDLHVKYLCVIMWIGVPKRVICFRLAHITVFFILFYTFFFAFFLKYEQKRVSWDKNKTRLMRLCRQNESKWMENNLLTRNPTTKRNQDMKEGEGK